MFNRLVLLLCVISAPLAQAEEVVNFDIRKQSCVSHSDSNWGYYGQLSQKQGKLRKQILLPNDWGLRYASCGRSLAPLHRQSPIELPMAEALRQADRGEVRFDGYGRRKVHVEHNCHTVQATVIEEDSPAPPALVIGGQPYQLLQFHVHTPSEHVIRANAQGTINYPGELHFVHAAVTGDGSIDGSRLAVVGVFIDIETDAAAAVDEFFRNMAEDYAGTRTAPRSEQGDIEVDIDKLAGGSGQFWRYQGSLTTPPCSETVEWVVRADPLTMSLDTYRLWQTEKLNVGFANSRPPALPTAEHQLRFNRY